MTNAKRLVTRQSPIGITMGDAAGIGPEVILKALDGKPGRVRIFGYRAVFEMEQEHLGTHVDLGMVEDVAELPDRIAVGRVQKSCGIAAFQSLEAGVAALRDRSISSLVTAPVSKEALRLAGFRWPGQTEYLADRLGAEHTAMLAWTPRYKAVFVTIHLPLARVAKHITAEAVAEKALLLADFLRAETPTNKSPRLAVLALNPHGAEFSLGEEDRIKAGVALARKRGVNAVGPIPADAALASISTTRPLDHSTNGPHPAFDGFVAMYHDQAMIPAKLLGRDAGVNVTLGLGRVRTSPLHGTAFDIAGKGIADAGSMRAAIRLARKLARRGT